MNACSYNLHSKKEILSIQMADLAKLKGGLNQTNNSTEIAFKNYCNDIKFKANTQRESEKKQLITNVNNNKNNLRVVLTNLDKR